MQSLDTLTMIFTHHLWANVNLLQACAKLTEEQLDAKISGSFGSIRETLEHIVTSELSYLSRISTGQPYDYSNYEPPQTIAAMIESAQETGKGFIEWAPRIGADDDVEINWDGTLRMVPKNIILTQVINHGTEHRAQIQAILTQLGIESPDLQSWEFFDQGMLQSE